MSNSYTVSADYDSYYYSQLNLTPYSMVNSVLDAYPFQQDSQTVGFYWSGYL